MGEVQNALYAPLVGEQVRYIQLIVLLPVVVGLVGVIHHFAVHLIFARRIVCGVGVEFCAVGSVPGNSGSLATYYGQKFYKGAMPIPRQSAIEALLVGAAAAHKAVAGQTTVSKVETEAAFHNPGTGTEAVLTGVPAAETDVGRTVGTAFGVEGLHVDGGSKGRAASGRGSHATLYLHTLGHTPDVGNIVPEHSLAFGVVERNTVDVDIDAAGINTTNAQRRDTHRSVLARGHNRRHRLNHEGNAHSTAGLVQLFVSDVACGEGRRVAHTHIPNNHLLQCFHRIGSLCEGMCSA